MTLIDEEVAAKAPDALQAAYFRTSLRAERARLLAEVAQRADEIDKRTTRGNTSAIPRLRSNLRGVETQVHQVEWLIQRLDRRFAHCSAERN